MKSELEQLTWIKRDLVFSVANVPGYFLVGAGGRVHIRNGKKLSLSDFYLSHGGAVTVVANATRR